jgi:uncharacterized membrane protein
MSQDEINERERNNPENWSKPLGFYRSRQDSRVWVRKPKPWMGWSLNLAKPLAWAQILVFLLLLGLLMASILVFGVLQK